MGIPTIWRTPDGSYEAADVALAEGNILRGNSSGVASAHSAKTTGQILVGDGTTVASVAVSGDTTMASTGATTVTDLTITSEARGDLLRRGASAWERVAAKTSGNIMCGDGTDVISAAMSGDATISAAGAVTIGANKVTRAKTQTRLSDVCSIDFTQEPSVAIYAKLTMAIVTAANAQQDFFYAGYPADYFELAQGVGATGANTLLAANGLTPGTNGWLLTCDNTATDSIEITQGIVLGSARSYLTGTSAAFNLKCAILVPTRASVTHFGVGFRKLVAYETANTYAEWQTAYAEKAMIGFSNNAGAFTTETSKATPADTSTALAHAAHANADLMALQVLVDGSGNVTYKLATTTPAGGTAAQLQAAVTTAYAALATDASAVAFQFTAGTQVVPSIILGASGAAAPDFRLINYSCGLT